MIAGVVSFWSPQVFSNGNIANVAQAAAPLVIMSLGVLLVIITSGIDLSVGSTFSLSGMVAGLAMLPFEKTCGDQKLTTPAIKRIATARATSDR